MFSTSGAADPLIPEFHARSRLAIARDVAIVLLCVALVLAFLAEVWSGARAKPSGASTEGPRPPPALVTPASAV